MKPLALKFSFLAVSMLFSVGLSSVRAETWAKEEPGVTGVQEFTFAGSGTTNTDFNDSSGGATLGYGVYFSEDWQAVLRQSIEYSNAANGPRRYMGSTKVAFDFNFNLPGSAMPFIGVNLGTVYGSNFRDSWSGGFEAGVKYYVVSKVFVFVMADYGWLFRHGDDFDKKFEDARLTWSAGIGFNF